MRYAEVLLPLPFVNTFTYRIPEAMAHTIGLYCRVVAPFGKKRYYTGVVIEIHDRCPEQDYEVKDLFALLDEKPVINHFQLSFWRWIASYYLCTLGEVCRAALPSGLITENETLKKGFKPKTEIFIRLADYLQTEADLIGIIKGMKRAKQQEKLFLNFLELSGVTTSLCNMDTEASSPDMVTTLSASADLNLSKYVLRKTLLDFSGGNVAVLNGLLQRGVLVADEKVVSRINLVEPAVGETPVLTQAQQKTMDELKNTFETHDVVLLHGGASSGRTEFYIRLIREVLSRGLQALYLLPEIAFATQLTERLQLVFGAQLLIYNSGIADSERVEIWNRLLQSGEPYIVSGVRSSVFLPFDRLGLVVIDEEQETSYKQQDPAPRYHARNAAMMLAKQHNAKTLLGAATPSLETWFWANEGKYGYVKFDNPNENNLRPTIEVVNISELRRKKQMKDTLFSPLLKGKIDEALSTGEQVILFQNRRGFAPFVVCSRCEEIPHCVNCDVSMTFHKHTHRLVCHYCGYSTPFPLRCSSCGHEEMKMQGFGTEKIEEEVSTLFPSAKTARLDLDTARTGKTYKRILADFKDGKTHILIGTQLVAKGVDFTDVGVAGVINVDGMMNIPDFRAYERTFQLMIQVTELAVRRIRRGFVVIQTSQVENPLLQMIQRFDYQGMAKMQLQERYQFRYPPYTRLILLVLRCLNEPVLDEMAELYVQRLKKRFGSAVSGPVYPPVTRVQTFHVRKIMLKIELSESVAGTRKMLEEVRMEMQGNPLFRQIILHYDVDPQ